MSRKNVEELFNLIDINGDGIDDFNNHNNPLSPVNNVLIGTLNDGTKVTLKIIGNKSEIIQKSYKI